jgi:hypothetical protein
MKREIRGSKVLVLLLLISVLFAFKPYQIKDYNIQKYDLLELDKGNVFSLLFDNVTLDSNGIAVWDPNFYEKVNFNISYDGKCHTSIDTILFFRDIKNRECCAVVFKTLSYSFNEQLNQVEIVSCHFCDATISIALFYKTKEERWRAYAFNKKLLESGLFGGVGKDGIGNVSMNKIKDEYFLLFKKPIAGNDGDVKGKEILYTVDQYSNLACDPLSELFYNIYYSEKGENKKHRIIQFSKSDYINLVVKQLEKGRVFTEKHIFIDDLGKYSLK